MGRAISLLYAQEGAAVMVNYSQSQKDAEDVVREIEAAGGTAVAFRADVRKEAEVKGMMAEVDKRWGRLDVLMNNAGWSTQVPHKNLDALTDEIWDRTLDVNLRGLFYCMRAAVPLLRRHPGAAIVNLASSAAYHAAGSSMIYAAAKAGAVSLTKSMARALAPDIRVNAICPGLVHTRFAGWPEEAFGNAQKITPVGHLATVDEVARLALFLAVDATAMTGEAILMDGGLYQLGRSR